MGTTQHSATDYSNLLLGGLLGTRRDDSSGLRAQCFFKAWGLGFSSGWQRVELMVSEVLKYIGELVHGAFLIASSTAS